MFSNWSLRRRLVLIVFGISLIILSVVAVLALNVTTGILDGQTQFLLQERSRLIANGIDAQMNTYVATTQTLSAIVNPTTLSQTNFLWDQARAIIGNTDAEIRSLNILRPVGGGYKYSSFYFEGIIDGTVISSLASVLYDGTLDETDWIYNTLVNQETVWLGAHEGSFANLDDEDVISVASPVTNFAGVLIGVVWIEVPVDFVQAQAQGIISALETLGRGENYFILVDDRGLPVIVNGLRLNRFGATAQAEVNQLVAAALADSDGYFAASDPFFEERTSLFTRSQLESNGWVLISAVPANLYQNTLGSGAFTIVAIALVGFAGLGYLIYLFVTSTVSNPLQQMARATVEIGSGDMRYAIEYQERGDEVGEFARALDDMKRNLQMSYERLAQWNRELERRVSERTLELNAARLEAQMIANDLQSVYDASLELVSDYRLNTVLSNLSDEIEELMETSYYAVWLLTDDEQNLRLVATSDDQAQIGHEIGTHEGIAGYALNQAKPVIIDDYQNWEHRLDWMDEGISHALAVPLLYVRKAVGVLVIGRTSDSLYFNDNDMRLVTLLANLASPVVRNAQLYTQVERARRQAENANLIKTRFLASISHELRNPLNLVINNMDFMRIGMFGEVNEDQISRLDQTIRSAEHLLYLINDLLDVSKIEAGEMKMVFQPTDLYPIIEDTIDSALALIPEGKNLAFIPSIPDDVPTIIADGRRVRQILLNLLSNAVKFTSEGEIHLRIFNMGDHVQFEVHDTGIGIAEEDFEGIFNAFERSSRTTHIEGTGLGLAISKFLIEAHGGQLVVTSQIGMGSTFVATLPLFPPESQSKSQVAAFVDPKS
jgi:signal transduction histidine kinase/HAMP domain-containing protein